MLRSQTQDSTVVKPDTTSPIVVPQEVKPTEIATDIPTETEVQKSTTFTHSIQPSLGLNFQNISRSDEETLTAQWTASLRARFDWQGSALGLSSSLFLQYGQLHQQGMTPEKIQDNIIATVMPSLALIPKIGIRLFCEVTGETTMKEGKFDDVTTKFLDPLYLYQSFFLGQIHNSEAEDGSGNFSLTYGVGYALQQTIADKFILNNNRRAVGGGTPLGQVQDVVTFKSGLCAIIDFNAQKTIIGKLNLSCSIKTVALGREETYKDLTESRVGTLALLSLAYGGFTIDYNMRLLYDKSFSNRRSIDQSLVAGVRFKF